jgi:hypothetical protein
LSAMEGTASYENLLLTGKTHSILSGGMIQKESW